ncbi:MAG: ABC transporter permease, partial [Planctomycetaceae bacterium]|nr:ABC transporter permease [Planctomycetaceae bacterium]
VAAAVTVAQEKDRRTLDLLLITRLHNSELVLGKLLASLLPVFTFLIAGAPIFALMTLWGGLALDQIARVLIVTLLGVLVSGSLGSTLGLWREKTFQTVALTTLGLVTWTLLWEVVARGLLSGVWSRLEPQSAIIFSPWHAVLAAVRPLPAAEAWFAGLSRPLAGYLLVSVALTVLLNAIAAWRIRAWNIAADSRRRGSSVTAESPDAPRSPLAAAAPQPSRVVWDNPVLWREMATWAYGRRTLLLRLAYAIIVALVAMAIMRLGASTLPIARFDSAAALVPILLLSLLLINAQSVTSITSERDVRALDLLLVTEITPIEFVFGKLGGALYNVKEAIVAPLVLSGYLWWVGGITLENWLYLSLGWLIVVIFAAVLGLHAGLSYVNSRAAIGVSLGTLFFLFVGIATTMRIMAAFSGSFEFQLQPFLAAMVGGGVGLYIALGARNPSPAIRGAALVCPFATFYALTSFLLNYPLAVLLVIAATYGFTTAAMLVPAIDEFDVATGRTNFDE